MNPRICFSCLVVSIAASFLVVFVGAQQSAPSTNWPSFRGTAATGVAEGYPLPAVWDVPAGKSVVWKTTIPGLGNSSPIIWGDKILVSTSISSVQNPELKAGYYGDIASVKDDTEHRWLVYCLDKKSGKILWQKTAYVGVPKVKRHPKSTHASSTLATDGHNVVAFFGSEGLYCFDMDGNLLWKKDLGTLNSAYYVAPEAQWEFGSSPVIYQDRVLIQCDVLGSSFVAALSLKDGKELWRTSRDDVPTWSTPGVYASGGNAQMIVNGLRHIGGYDVKTGKELWWMKGGGDIPIPTPVIANGVVYITNAHGAMAPIYAIRLGATGDISLKPEESSNGAVVWSYPRDGAYISTPLVYGDYVYSVRFNGVLLCYEAKTGNRAYQERLGDGTTAFSASPVAGDGKVYFSSEDGDIYVVKAGTKLEILSKNPMGAICLATPAISGGVLYFRTRSELIAIK